MNLNASSFAPGPLYVDSPTEIWGEYFFIPIGGAPFTFFYKDDAAGPIVDPSEFLVPQNFELFYAFERYYPYRAWQWKWCMFFDEDNYANIKIKSPYTTTYDEPYWDCYLIDEDKFLN